MPLNPSELTRCISALSANNNKAWFDEHRADYQTLRAHFIEMCALP